MPEAVFTYGTLQVPEVMLAVTGKDFQFITATLPGYRRYGIRKRVYPAITPDDQASTQGTLYLGIDTVSLELLDQFEDVLYERKVVEVISGDKTMQAYAYVINEQFKSRLDNTDWDLQEFRNRHLQTYLGRI